MIANSGSDLLHVLWDDTTGFRLTMVAKPSTLVLAVLGSLALLAWRRNR